MKKSGTANAVPASLSYGELAINYADGLLYYKNAAGTVVPLTARSGLNAKLDALTFNGSTTTFNLTSGAVAVSPAAATSLLVSLNGVVQEPGVGYTVSGSQITFSVAPASTDTFFGVHLTGGSGGSSSGAGGDAVMATPAQITSDQNNYALPSSTDIVRLSSDAVRTITGIEADAGSVVTLYNVGSFDIRVDHEDTASLAANRVISATGSDVVIAPNDSITLVYDSTSARWRTAGVVKTAITGQAAVYEFLRGSAPIDATGANGTWTWTVPAAAKAVLFQLRSGGGGGGTGRRGAAGTIRAGGGGGGGGGYAELLIATSRMAESPLTILVGAGGAGAAAPTTNDTNGNQGFGGTASYVQHVGGLFVLRTTTGGAAGSGGTNVSAANGGGGGTAAFNGTAGAGGSGTAAGGNSAHSFSYGSPGGSGAGGVDAANVSYAGGNGSRAYVAWNNADPAGGTNTGGAGASAAGYTHVAAGLASSGGGGGGNAAGGGGIGGDGAYGSGGGGGGGGLNGFSGGAGGNGGDGYVRITVWY